MLQVKLMDPGAKVGQTLTLTGAFQVILRAYPIGILRLTMVHLVNVTATDATVRLCYVANGGTPTVANAILWDFVVPANDFIEFGAQDYLPASTSIQAMSGTASAINIRVAGVQEG